MRKALEAIVDELGNVRLTEPLSLGGRHRALVLILDGDSAIDEPALLSEPALAADWSRPEEDLAWAHLQPEKSS